MTRREMVERIQEVYPSVTERRYAGRGGLARLKSIAVRLGILKERREGSK